jgi:hypothetical protein
MKAAITAPTAQCTDCWRRAVVLTARRAITLGAAFCANPNRFKGVVPQPPKLPEAAWITTRAHQCL